MSQNEIAFYLEKFLEHLKKQRRSISTILAYKKDIKQLISFLEEKGISQVNSVKKEDLEGFKEDLIQKNYDLKSVSRKLNALKSFFKFLGEQGIANGNPASLVSHPKYQPELPRILSKLEYRALRDACRNDSRMAAIIELMLQTGIRIGEVSRLKISDIKEKEMFIEAYESQPARIVPLNESAKKAIERYLLERPKKKSKFLFLTKTGRPLLIRNIRAAINRYFKEAGIEKAKVNDLRTTWLVHHLIKGTSPVVLQKLAGHKRLSTTERYLQFIKGEKEIEKLKLEEL